MKCTINWGVCTRTQWENMLQKCQHVTILQSYYYAQAMREIHFQSVRHGIISINDEPAGIVQMQEVSLFGKAIHFISIDRGPLWFDGFGSAEHQNAFWNTINEKFPRRIGRKRRFIPEISSDNDITYLKNAKKIKKKTRYKTFFIDLVDNFSEIEKKFNKNWRRNLKKGRKNDLNIKIDQKLESLSVFLHQYTIDKVKKSYSGPSPKFLASMCKYAAMSGDCLIFNAKNRQGHIIGSILLLTHGKGATYQTGWTTDQGRDVYAHHVLFHHALQYLKKHGVTCFDLGGYNDNTAGLEQFKRGLGGQDIALIGSYS